ncbi:MAG: hypothetical protein ACI807_001583 [Paracoccaceae bacterium]|jgi:hypothetical protein
MAANTSPASSPREVSTTASAPKSATASPNVRRMALVPKMMPLSVGVLSPRSARSAPTDPWLPAMMVLDRVGAVPPDKDITPPP